MQVFGVQSEPARLGEWGIVGVRVGITG